MVEIKSFNTEAFWYRYHLESSIWCQNIRLHDHTRYLNWCHDRALFSDPISYKYTCRTTRWDDFIASVLRCYSTERVIAEATNCSMTNICASYRMHEGSPDHLSVTSSCLTDSIHMWNKRAFCDGIVFPLPIHFCAWRRCFR